MRKRKNVVFFASILLLFGTLSVCLNLFHYSETEQESVLFIGNSYTYRNKGIDQHIQTFLDKKKGLRNYYTRAAQGKYHLHTHWRDPKTKQKFEQRKWDKVVLQEFSKGPVVKPNAFMKYGKKWARRIRAKNKDATIFLYETWCYKKRPYMTDSLHTMYEKLAKEIDATVIPVGKMWATVQEKVNLYDGDNAHPNRKGTYLTACLFYEYLENKDVRKTPHLDKKLAPWVQKKLKRLAHEFRVDFDKQIY